MSNEAIVVEKEIGGKLLRIETGKLAKQAHGSVLVRLGDTIVLSAACEGPSKGQDFFPLTVDYREPYYAAGRFPGGYRKREGQPTTNEILTSRLADRPIRPLFPEGYNNEIQVQSKCLSADRQNNPDVLSINGASAALFVSHVPFSGPVGAVRMGRVDGKLIVFPTTEEMATSDLDLVVAGIDDAVCMIEGFSKEIPEAQMADAIMAAHGFIREIIAMQRELREKTGKPPVELPAPKADELLSKLRTRFFDDLKTAKRTDGKQARAAAVAAVYETATKEFVPATPAEGAPTADRVKKLMHHLEEKAVRDLILTGTRLDGRAHGDIRELFSEVNCLPRVHGSAVFQRGETQALLITTLGSVADGQKIDGLTGETSKRFMLDYNFPPFSVGETRPIRGPGRREIGHGMLAERSLAPVLPAPEKFPYTIRLISEILESNGSSSMATVCGGTLCLMDAGVPIKDPVAGISIGLVLEEGKHVLLTDIMGDEDHFGDMDFKVAGTQRGITGIQLDLKITGINEEIIRDTLTQAREARIEILKHMLRTLKRPNKNISEFAPRLVQIKINKEKIGAIIGPGGKHIRALQEETKTTINIEDDGTVTICGPDLKGTEEARNRIEAIAEDVQIGKIYKGRVSSITDFGAFIEVVPGRDGLCHISELDHGYVGKVADVVKVGDIIDVKVINIDDHDRVKLSRKALLAKPEGVEERPAREDRGPRGDRGGDRGPRGGGDRGPRDGGDRGGYRGGRGGDDRGPRGGDREERAPRDGGDRGPRDFDRDDDRGGRGDRPEGGDRGPRDGGDRGGYRGRGGDDRGPRGGGDDRGPRDGGDRGGYRGRGGDDRGPRDGGDRGGRGDDRGPRGGDRDDRGPRFRDDEPAGFDD
jgi:polyribonucleotide nucleotidyltransferase